LCRTLPDFNWHARVARSLSDSWASCLEYANTAWSPYKQYLIEEVEKVQKRATKLVHGCKHLPYTERLKYLKLPTLKYRRHRGDIIETYKIIHRLYDTAVAPSLMMSQVSHTRGNMYKLQKTFSDVILENIFFTERVVNFGTRCHPWLSMHRRLIVLRHVRYMLSPVRLSVICRL